MTSLLPLGMKRLNVLQLKQNAGQIKENIENKKLKGNKENVLKVTQLAHGKKMKIKSMFVEKLNRDENPRFCRMMFSFVILFKNAREYFSYQRII